MTRTDRLSLIDVITRLDTELDVQHGRVGLLQRWLDDQEDRLQAISARVDQTAARIDALLARCR